MFFRYKFYLGLYYVIKWFFVVKGDGFLVGRIVFRFWLVLLFCFVFIGGVYFLFFLKFWFLLVEICYKLYSICVLLVMLMI